ncbi:MAG: ABC transporter substrate-binding protein [Burkholderiaceae bacterium]|nr:ABC transporter substrate-binding protein [Burkholderiaceae bacterium]
MQLTQILATLVCAVAASGPAFAQTQGVTKDQIVIGTIQDLSGPVAAFGKHVRMGMQMRVDEINEQGGINGRKLVLKVEDSGYDPKRAVLAAQKLVDQDQIFAMVSHTGSAHNVATFPVLFEKNVFNFLPMSASREMYEAPNRFKYAFWATYYDQMRMAVPKLAKENGAKKLCAIYQDDEFGIETLRGAEAGAKAMGTELAEKSGFKRAATDFSSQVARAKAAGCELVVLGSVVRETIGIIAEARKTGFNPIFLATSAAYLDLIHKLGGKAMDGLYATMTTVNPYVDDADEAVRAWAQKYKAKYNDEPSAISAGGYISVDVFAKAAQKAGANLTPDSFIQAMSSLRLPPNIFGLAEMTFSDTKRLGNEYARLSQIQNGRWKVVSDYMK